jgi:GNAT superfamily N-acetyltransferase
MNRNIPITVRDGTESDIPHLRDQMLMTQELHRSAFPELFRKIESPEAEAFLRERLEDARCFLRVAVLDGGPIVGHTVSEIQERPASLFAHSQSVLYLAQIVVDAQYRKRGVGRRLIEDVFAIARTRGVSRVELNVWEVEGTARGFFSDQGFRDVGHRMAHTIVDPA